MEPCTSRGSPLPGWGWGSCSGCSAPVAPRSPPRSWPCSASRASSPSPLLCPRWCPPQQRAPAGTGVRGSSTAAPPALAVAGGVPGTIVGAVASGLVGGAGLLVLSGFMLLAVGARMLAPDRGRRTRPAATPAATTRTLVVGATFAVGLLTGLLANGGGFLLVPLFVLGPRPDHAAPRPVPAWSPSGRSPSPPDHPLRRSATSTGRSPSCSPSGSCPARSSASNLIQRIHPATPAAGVRGRAGRLRRLLPDPPDSPDPVMGTPSGSRPTHLADRRRPRKGARHVLPPVRPRLPVAVQLPDRRHHHRPGRRRRPPTRRRAATSPTPPTHGLRIERVIETHFHADFLSGHLELAEATGAAISYGDGAAHGLPDRAPRRRDRDSRSGDVVLEIRAHPRPHPGVDLGRGVGARRRRRAVGGADRRHAVHRRRRPTRPADLRRLDRRRPGPAAVPVAARPSCSPCPTPPGCTPPTAPARRAASSCPTAAESTIGEQRATNYALAPMTEDEFVDVVTEGQTRRAPSTSRSPPTPTAATTQLLDDHEPPGAVTVDEALDVARSRRRRARHPSTRDLRARPPARVGQRRPRRTLRRVRRRRHPPRPAHRARHRRRPRPPRPRIRLARIGFDRVDGQLADIEAVLARPARARRPRRAAHRRPTSPTCATRPADVQIVDIRNPGEQAGGTHRRRHRRPAPRPRSSRLDGASTRHARPSSTAPAATARRSPPPPCGPTASPASPTSSAASAPGRPQVGRSDSLNPDQT